MQDEIRCALRKLEQTYDCRILFAAESGSRAWGFASPDSDYDIRAIYVKPHDWYLSVEENQKDTIEAMLPNNLDIAAWELRKTLRQFAKSNLPLFEWFGSPIIYESTPSFMSEFLPLIPEFFNPVKAVHHYLSIHDKGMGDLDGDGQISIKKLFYALRGFFAARWSFERESMPPTQFDCLLLPELFPAEILELIDVLKHQKEIAVEKQRVSMPPKLLQFFQDQCKTLRNHSKSLKKPNGDSAALNRILRRFILGDA
jgi:predicted nucleotidyltransferase